MKRPRTAFATMIHSPDIASQPPPVLAVDLDGTLVRSDTLFESFWAALARDWRSLYRSVASLVAGRANLKRYLADASELEVASLPYDPTVVSYIRRWRDEGGRTALVTAGDQAVADRVAGHLDLFDEVHGSDGRRNLKGEVKAEFLTARFGTGGFDYMGDAAADLPVWEKARRAITVNAPERLRRRADRFGAEHLETARPSPASYLRALRPHQWLKNALVFLPMLAAHQLTGAALAESLLAFVAFSLVASSVYVLNDLLDLSADRAHPRKRNRPFASGAVPVAHGSWMAPGLLLAGAAVALALGWTFVAVMAIYYFATTAYSLWLKRHLIIDICALAALYTMRLVAGGVATGIDLSVWFLAFSVFFFFSLAAVKRQAELVDSSGRGDAGASGRGYLVGDLPLISMIAIGSGYVSVLVMALYVNSPGVLELYSAPPVLWGICLVLLYWISRIVMVTHRGNMHDDPVVYAAKDRVSQVCAVLIAGFVVAGALL